MKNKLIFTVLLHLILLIILTGCNHETVATEPNIVSNICDVDDKRYESAERDIILRVATLDISDPSFDDWKLHIEKWEREFEWNHRNVDVVLENFLVTERFQTELMAGRGPDVILSPTTAEWMNLNWRQDTGPIPISDVNFAMRNGIFYDISEFYDADTDLDKDALMPAVMEAGMVDGKRYVLPLRYNLLAAYVDLERFAETGLSTDIFEQDIIGFRGALAKHGSSSLASSAIIRSQFMSELNLIGESIDYDNQEVLLTQDKLVEYLQAYQDFLIVGQGEVSDFAILHNYYSVDTKEISGYSGWMGSWKCMLVGGLDLAIHNAVIAKAEGINLGMYPLRSADGSVTADITFYGAVTGGTDNPELAYEFLRYFLTEESQWETKVTTSKLNDSSLMLAGWPVRVKGSASAMYNHLRRWINPILQSNETVEGFSEEDMPILDIKVDKVRFPIGLEMTFHHLGGHIFNSYTMTEEYARTLDLGKIAAEFIEDLEWHVGEG